METASNLDDTMNLPKAKKRMKKKLSGNNADHSQDKTIRNTAIGSDDMPKSEWIQIDYRVQKL